MTHSEWLRNETQKAAASTSASHIVGRWYNVQIRPDIGAGDTLNVGVVFVDSSDRVHLKMAQDLSRLSCLYDDSIDVASFERLCGILQSGFNGTEAGSFQVTKISPNAAISESRYASGSSIEEILGQLFEATVPVARARDIERQARSRAKSISSEQAAQIILGKLTERMGAAALPYISSAPWTVREPSGAERKIALPIRKPGKLCASVVSVWTKDEYRRKFQLAKAGLDLDTVREHSQDERLGLFVLRPAAAEGYSEADLQRIDDEIDDTAWQLRRLANIQVESSEDADRLTDALKGWLEIAA